VPAEAAASGLVVQTQRGAVSGVSVGAENEWRGIPYAAPPVGAFAVAAAGPGDAVVRGSRRDDIRAAVHPT
jgi:hypothetical protein